MVCSSIVEAGGVLQSFARGINHLSRAEAKLASPAGGARRPSLPSISSLARGALQGGPANRRNALERHSGRSLQ
jgi:hypothetical protein